MYITWIEIKRFLDDNKLLIIIGTVLISMLLIAGLIFIQLNDAPISTENDNAEGVNLDSNPVYFQFYAELESGDKFANVSLLREYFNLSSVKEVVLEETGIDIDATEDQIEEEYQLDEESFSIPNFERESPSNVYTVQINTGNIDENITLINYYYEEILNKELNFLEDKRIYILQEPIEVDTNELQETDEMSDLSVNRTNDIQQAVLSNVFNIVIGTVIGFALMIGVALLKALFGKYLNYSFSYEVNEIDKFMLYDPRLDNEQTVSQFIGIPYDKQKIIIAEEPLDAHSKKVLSNENILFSNKTDNKTRISELNSLTHVNDSQQYSEIILAINPYITTRKWYKTQREILELLDQPVKIIQLNK